MDNLTSEKILQASMKLFQEKGYKKTTTKLIAAEAGVNEVTIFRLFGKKKVIIEEIIQTKLGHTDPLYTYFKYNATYNLSADLFEASMLYYNAMSKNLPLMISLLDELGSEFELLFSKLPSRVNQSYKSYFDVMYNKGLIRISDTNFLSYSFSTLVVGLALSKVLTNESIIDVSVEEFIKRNVEIFAKGIS